MEWKMLQPEMCADIGSRPIANFPHLSLDIMIRVYSKITSRYLYTEGILTIANAQPLANTFAKMIENSAEGILLSECDSKFEAINNGFINFLSSFIQFLPPKGWKLCVTYGNSFQLEAANNGLL
ncbi:hypothetical protein NPIL_549771 [Nephila pilipes]|uniref:Uncharacterized protein n=1 Tax=Nephila pilipes TaxID=299642 RepID=A0A8X6MMB7_NEPPI|nr:hypothetical protein NPIL_549771 [Nephila pilipes]